MVKYKNIVESFFNCKCNIYEYKEKTEDCFSQSELELVIEDLPCRRGYSTGGNINYAKTGESGIDNVSIKQLVKLFIPREVDITPGSLVMVMYGGCCEYYEYSGYGLLYDTHSEVMLKSVERWA
jgi:hypothetical protein